MPILRTFASPPKISNKKLGSAEALLGNLLAWGAGVRTGIFDTGNLGDGFSVDRSSPVHVGALRTWLIPSAMYQQAMCTKSDGTLWSWGRNSGYGAGALGLGDFVDRSSPVQIGALTTWLTPCMAYTHGMCVKTDGTLWLWGKNNYGQLGFNNTTDTNSPVQLGNITTWSQPTSRGQYSFCTRTDNTLWSWGQNTSGQMGTNDTIERSSPVQLGGAEWSRVEGHRYGGIAVKTAGSLWYWGSDATSIIGNAPKGRSSPAQVGSNTNWSRPTASRRAALCTTTGGQLWAIGGNNVFGMLALNESPGNGGLNSYRSSPIQIGALSTWLRLASTCYSNEDSACCTKTDGTLWAWGRPNRGQIGISSTANAYGISSPTQIGTKTNWVLPVGSLRSFMCTTT